MNKLFYTAIIALFLIGIFSCEDKFINDIDIEVPDEELQLVINLDLNEGDTIAKTFVARTSNIDEAESTFFSEAIVELYKESDLLTTLDYVLETNDYTARLDPQDLCVGEYTIEVSGIDGFNDIRATQSIPQEVTITEGVYQENGTVEQYYTYAYTVDEALIKFQDPEEQENYYHIRLYGVIEDENGNEFSRSEFFVTSLNPFAETSFNYDGLLLRDNSFNGSELELSIGFSNFLNYGYGGGYGEFTPYLLVELNNVSRDYYLYEKSLAAQLNANDNPFAEPVIVHNNLENGIGIFKARNSSEFRIDLE